MISMDDLVTWLREQIAAARKLALQCIEDDERASRYDETRIHVTRFNIAYHDDYRGTEAAPEHAALRQMFDPAAVLAQCDAHEALLDLHVIIQGLCGVCHERDYDWPCKTLRVLALAYRHRPGYREEWRP